MPIPHREGLAVDRELKPLCVGGGEARGLAGSVTGRTFQGAATIVAVRLDGSDVLVAVHVSGSAAAHLVPGDRVNVVIDGARGVCESPTREAVLDPVP